jgi:hypothetical protein
VFCIARLGVGEEFCVLIAAVNECSLVLSSSKNVFHQAGGFDMQKTTKNPMSIGTIDVLNDEHSIPFTMLFFWHLSSVSYTAAFNLC